MPLFASVRSNNGKIEAKVVPRKRKKKGVAANSYAATCKKPRQSAASSQSGFKGHVLFRRASGFVSIKASSLSIIIGVRVKL